MRNYFPILVSFSGMQYYLSLFLMTKYLYTASDISPREIAWFGLNVSQLISSKRLYVRANCAYLCDQWLQLRSFHDFVTPVGISSHEARASIARNSTRVTALFGSKSSRSVDTIFLFTASETRGFTQCSAGISWNMPVTISPCGAMSSAFNTIPRSSDRVTFFSLLNVPSSNHLMIH